MYLYLFSKNYFCASCFIPPALLYRVHPNDDGKKSLDGLQLQLFSHVTRDILVFLNEMIIASFTHQ